MHPRHTAKGTESTPQPAFPTSVTQLFKSSVVHAAGQVL